MLTLMLQGHSRKESREIGMEYLEKVGMGEIDPDKKVFELSGGERQRIAFIRAICPEFTVLLGDEPTGNLDRFTSRKLMQILQSSIHEKEGSAIIVSHDIDLSVEFADQLIIISKKEEQPGSKNEFYDYEAKYIDDATEYLFDTIADEKLAERINIIINRKAKKTQSPSSIDANALN